jgi:hypothetical protein
LLKANPTRQRLAWRKEEISRGGKKFPDPGRVFI